MNDTMHLGFEIGVVAGDALEFVADVLAVKDVPHFHGMDTQITQRMNEQGLKPEKMMLSDGSYLISGEKAIQPKQVLYINVEQGTNFNYTWLRDFARRILANLYEANVNPRHLALTIHGPLLGFDEVESFRVMLLGMSDAYAAETYPASLERITFVEFNVALALRLADALRQFLPASEHSVDPDTLLDSETQQLTATGRAVMTESVEAMRNVLAGPDSFEPEFSGPEADETTPHVFVAMPFRDTYDDQFYLAIQPTVKDRGYLCERMDLDTFTGDITDRMFDRIRTARLVIALLDSANPNVYLEVGYAWGVGTQTVLLAHSQESLPFDVRGRRILIYDKIYLLKQMLEAELERLLD